MTVEILDIYAQFIANSSQPVTHVFISPGVAWLYVPYLDYVHIGQGGVWTRDVFHTSDHFVTLAQQS